MLGKPRNRAQPTRFHTIPAFHSSLRHRHSSLRRKIVSMTRIYMDANATTPLLPEVFEAMRPFWIEHFGNASSIHQHGQFARAAVDHARDSIARLLHCRASEIVFTSGGTESDNLALFGTVTSELSATKEKTHVITVSIMFANNETGVVQPIAALAAIAHAAGALFHTDAVQAAGKVALDLSPHGP